jgi:hypothetical protein
VTEDVQHAFEEDRDVLNAVLIDMANKTSPHIDPPIDGGPLRFRRHRSHKYVGAVMAQLYVEIIKKCGTSHMKVWRKNSCSDHIRFLCIHMYQTSRFD